MNKPKLIRVTTVPGSLMGLLEGQPKFMSKYFQVIGISSTDEYINHSLIEEREGIKMHTVEMTRKITPFKDLKAVIQLYRILKKEKPSIVHSHTPKAGTLGMTAAYFARVPLRLHTIAGLPLLEETGIKRRLLDTVEKITYRFATKIYPNSFGLEKIILDNGYIRKEKLKVIGKGSSNGINLEHFNPSLYDKNSKLDLKKSLGIKTSDFVFLFVGRMVKDKGINELVTSFSMVCEKYNNAKLVLVGQFENDLDPLLPKTEKLIETDKNIIYTGFKKDVRPYFSIADVFTFPSYREGFPNVVMQAGAMGIPSIVSDINGCNEIIIEGKNGVIIKVKNIEELYQQMTLFIEKKSNNIFDPIQIRSLISERYSRLIIWEEILKEYYELKEKMKINKRY